jgi:tight adherence protein B
VFALAILVLVLLGASALIAAFRLQRQARRAMAARIELITAHATPTSPHPADASGGLLKAGTRKFDDQVRGLFAIGRKSVWAMRAGSFTLFSIAAAGALVAWLLTHSFFGMSSFVSVAMCALAAFFGPRFVLSRQQRRTERAFTELFPDAVDTVARMVRAGLPITAAVRTVAIEAPPPISTVFAAIADQMRIGVPIEEILDRSSAEIRLPDFRFFATAVGLQYATGGNLTNTLESLSEIIRKRRAARLKAQAGTGEIRMTAYTLAGIPVVTIGALLVIQPGYLIPLWTDPRGHYIIIAAATCLFLAFITIRAMMRSVTDN